ncbi:hypothetical protein CYMTET_8296 [Cymbomonas tetramitiformis]|uniref:Uncharacterized protein n=1 Tax=Cymbomonas tetramitiformis TaxID=36881 RepID=A0AAE0LG54_9CHLO|nr:hypothetical protein CYMTET_8296 [Cymbomonas tetramitiformis]
MTNPYAYYFITLTSGFTIGSLWSFGLYLFSIYIETDIANEGERPTSEDAQYQDFNMDHARQHFINLSMYVFNGLSNVIKYGIDAAFELANGVVTYRYLVLLILVLTVAAFLFAFEGHTLVSKINLLYDEMHRPIMYPLKMYLRFLAMLYSGVVGAYNAMVIMAKRTFSIMRDTLLKLTADMLMELILAWSSFISRAGQELYDWTVRQHFVDASPDFLHSCLALQRGLWAVRECVIIPCGFTRLFWETLASGVNYYPPKAHNPIVRDDYYVPSVETVMKNATFNKFCYQHRLGDPAVMGEFYDVHVTYCRLCDFEAGVRYDCLPHNYHVPLAMNAAIASVAMLIKVPSQYILRTGGLRTDAYEGQHEADTGLLSATTAETSSDGQGYGAYVTFDGSEHKYCVCWNGYTGDDGQYPYGVPAEPYLHHAPWLLCEDYAVYYRTFDFDGLLTLAADAVGFAADSVDEWYMGCLNYMQYAVAHAVDLADARVCDNLYSVHPPRWSDTLRACVATPPTIATGIRGGTQALIGGVRIGARVFAYLPAILYELRDRWTQFFKKASDDATQMARVKERAGLIHQLLETPNTQGCNHATSVYPSTSTDDNDDVDVTVRNYCARNYVLDQMYLPALVVTDHGKAFNVTKSVNLYLAGHDVAFAVMRFMYRYATTLVFGAYQVPPASPAYPAPPPMPTPPPPPPLCKVPIVQVFDTTTSETETHVGANAWAAYRCGEYTDANFFDFINTHGANGYYAHELHGVRFAYGAAPKNLKVNCSFVDVYGAYGDLLRPNECMDQDGDGQCVLSGYPAYGDVANVDTSDLQTSPNVYLFDNTDQESCTCDADGSYASSVPTLYQCPTASYLPPRVAISGNTNLVRSYLASADGDTLEGSGDLRYPVCRALQVAMLDSNESEYSYGMAQRARCRMTASQYADGLVSEGYGVQAECSIVAVTDITDADLRTNATFILEDPARVMRLPVRIVERTYPTDQQVPKDPLGASPEWTTRYTEQVFAGYNLTDAPQPDWRSYRTIGGTYGGMHQPLCSCDPHIYVAPTAVPNMLRCLPRTLLNAPNAPPPIGDPPGPPPNNPAGPPLTSVTVCRDVYGSVMRGYRMQHPQHNIYPSDCVCADTDRAPIATVSGNKDTDVLYCPTTCVGDAIIDGPSCVCRAEDADSLRATANGGRRINNTRSESEVAATVQRTTDALSADTARTDVTSSSSVTEFAYSFLFANPSADARFPTIAQATSNFCESALGSEWHLHEPPQDQFTDYQRQLQDVLDAHINERTEAGVGSPVMDAHPLCARTYRVQLPPRSRARHGSNASIAPPAAGSKRATLNLARTLQRVVVPRGAEPYTQDDQTYVIEAVYNEVRASLRSFTGGETIAECVASKSLDDFNTMALSKLFDKDGYFLKYTPTVACDDGEYYMPQDDGLECSRSTVPSEDSTLPFSAGDGMFSLRDNYTVAHVNVTSPDANAKVGIFMNVSLTGRTTLLNHRFGKILSGDAHCQLPVVDTGESETDHCAMYVDINHRSAAMAQADMPKSTYTYGQQLLMRRRVNNAVHDCSPSNETADYLYLCSDANVLSPEAMGQAASFCGASLVDAAMRPSRARAVCAEVPHGFLFASKTVNSLVVPIIYRTDPRHNTSNPILDGKDAAVQTGTRGGFFHSVHTRANAADGRRYIAVCSRSVPSNITRASVVSDTNLNDGVRYLNGTDLQAARSALDDLRTVGAKCALNIEGSTYPMSVPALSTARANAAQRMAASPKRWFPFAWTRRGSNHTAGPVRFTLGAFTGDDGVYAQLNLFGRTRSEVPIQGRSVRLRIPGRFANGNRGSALGNRRTDPVLYGNTHPEFGFPHTDPYSAAGGGGLGAGQVLVADLCNDSLSGASTRTMRIRSAFDNRFLQAKGAGPHPAMPSYELRSGTTQHPGMRRTRPDAANPAHDMERYLQGQFDDDTNGTIVASHVYILYGGDHFKETLRQADGDLHDATGYLFEGDFRLTTGARYDTRGDVDPDGSAGLHGRFQESSDAANAPLRTRDAGSSQPFERSAQRLAFVDVHDATDVRVACTRKIDLSKRARTTLGFPRTAQDGRVDDGDCTYYRTFAYQNWGEGQPLTSSNASVDDATGLFEQGVFDCVAINVLTGSRCALWLGTEGSDPDNAVCAIGARVQFGEWSALPCEHAKPYVCTDGQSNTYYGTEPKPFEDARLHCVSMGMRLAAPPTDSVINRRLAVAAQNALCEAHLLQPYGDDACAPGLAPEIRHGFLTWSNSLADGAQILNGSSHYANCRV